MKQSEKNYKRIVIKIGSSIICPAVCSQDFKISSGMLAQIARLNGEGKEIIIVSSGAIAFGMDLLKLASRPKELSLLQAAASVGQNALMDAYSRGFSQFKAACGQVLLTWEDFNDRRRYLNAKNTLFKLLELNVIPVINENDAVSTDEIRFGDNDRLSALVAALVNADLLIILSDVEGLLDKDRKVIRIVDEITPEIRSLACPTDKKACVGGMITKIEAAKIAMGSGIPCVIANGREKDIILSVAGSGACGTLFLPKRSMMAKKRWLAFGTKPKGEIMIDEGAKVALLNKKSLLSVGVVGVEGDFDAGDIVSVIDKGNCELARGRAGLSSRQLDKVKGSRHDKEVIHRDNIVVL